VCNKIHIARFVFLIQHIFFYLNIYIIYYYYYYIPALVGKDSPEMACPGFWPCFLEYPYRTVNRSSSVKLKVCVCSGLGSAACRQQKLSLTGEDEAEDDFLLEGLLNSDGEPVLCSSCLVYMLCGSCTC